MYSDAATSCTERIAPRRKTDNQSKGVRIMVLIAKVDKAGILKDLDEIMSMTQELEQKATRLRERISIEESDTDSSIDSE